METPLDCLIIGAGPAGLTAAIYLSRFHLRLAVLDSGDSRAAMIPRTHNHAGYPGGIPGSELLARMREQARAFGVNVVSANVDDLAQREAGFVARASTGEWQTRAVLLATGVVNNRPLVAQDVHDAALARGLLRYCPICDGFEVTDRRIAVIGTGERGHAEAVFLRMYSASVTLISPAGAHDLSGRQKQELASLGIDCRDGPCDLLRIEGENIVVPTPGGALAFDTVYPALGSVIRSRLAVSLGARATDEGCLEIDAHQRTTVSGLYAAGDVTKGLDQISAAMGQAAIAATTIRNDLAQTSPIVRG
ncbi:MAG: thioredoxin reductase [Novosphingobium sp.]|nr:thioredoxin reductase [Novosphingobium sp.]